MSAKERLVQVVKHELEIHGKCLMEDIAKNREPEKWYDDIRELNAALELAKAIPEVSGEAKAD